MRKIGKICDAANSMVSQNLDDYEKQESYQLEYIEPALAIENWQRVRFMAGIQAEKPEQIKNYDWSGHLYDEGHSSDIEYVFIRTVVPGKGKR